jgi:hypothetical protein
MTDMTLIIFLIGTYLFGAIGTIVFIPKVINEDELDWWMIVMLLLFFVVYGIYGATSLFKSIQTRRLYIKRLSDSGELARMAMDFSYGKNHPEYALVLGQDYLFRKGSGIVYRYSDIVEIYHAWEDSFAADKFPYWRLYMKTADKKISILANISFLRSKENYFDKVLPLILEIRSKNADIVIKPLTSFKE